MVRSKCRGGSRILLRRGRQPSRDGAQTYEFGKFSEKLHEIEKSLDLRGGGLQERPLRSATVSEQVSKCLAVVTKLEGVFAR